MERKTIFQIRALYRDDFRVTGFSFGQGERAVCIVGSMRGNENQQLYCCAELVRKLKALEEKGCIREGREILVIPCVNPYSMNIKKRFWSIDNTDINRMFPGYSEGETTQRIAGGVFEAIKDYTYGLQFASFYMPGRFVPHIRIMKTGFEDVELAKKFGFPYVVLHTPRPFDTATLNYNWQIWETRAFSVYTTTTERIDRVSARQAVEAVLSFLQKQGIVDYSGFEGYVSKVVSTEEMVSVRNRRAGFFEGKASAGEYVRKGQLLACIVDCYEGMVVDQIYAPLEGTLLFSHAEPKVYENTAVYKIIPETEDW